MQMSNCASGALTFQAASGTTYYIMVSNFIGSPYPTPGGGVGGSLIFNLTKIYSNDYFADAGVINVLPFSTSVDTTYASSEANEPVSSCGGPGQSIWYSFTPSETASYSVVATGGYSTVVVIYQGTELANLTEVGCNVSYAWWGGGPLTRRLEAGRTYYFQTFISSSWWGMGLNFSLNKTPAPTVGMSYYPQDPSKFDTIQFSTSSSDPGNVGFASARWDFGDGTTSIEWNPAHKYAMDGDYTVSLSEITTDGRSGTTSKLVQVRTHDVVITKFTIPQTAKVNQTRSVTVEINNQNYPETVQVLLYKSTGNGYIQVGESIQFVPVKPANRTTAFTMNNTFTSQDAALGNINFRAVANIV